MILETLLPQLEFQSNIEDAVKQKMIKSRRQVEEIAATAYSSNDFDFLLCKRMPLTRLVVVVYLLTQTSLDKGTQRKTTENELPSLTQCTA